MRWGLRALGLVVLGLVGVAVVVGSLAEPPPITVTALEYGRARFARSIVSADAPASGSRPISFQVWLVRTPDRTILVDTGFLDAERAWDLDVEGFVPVSRLLRRELGLEPGDVTDVVITHAHWDHAGGLADFPDARVWIQARELSAMGQKLGRKEDEVSGFVRPDLLALRAHRHVTRVHERARIGEHVELRRGGGHTAGTQWVEVKTDPPIVLASDIVFVGENLERDTPSGYAHDVSEIRAAYAEMRAIPGVRVVPGHDPETMGGRTIVRLFPPPGFLDW